MYSFNLVQRTSGYDLYEMKPKYMPKPYAGADKSGFIGNAPLSRPKAEAGDESQASKVQSVDDLTAEQKEALVSKLNRGQGGLSYEEWDSFLIDLVDLGLISEDERMLSNGFAVAISNPNENGEWHSEVKNYTYTDVYESWDGNPLTWLNAMDTYLMKESKLAEYANCPLGGLATQRAACSKVSSIVSRLLYG